MATENKIRENRLRATAKRQGLVLHRSPRRDPRALDYGLYWLFLDNPNISALGSTDPVTPRAGVTLDEIERYLTGDRTNA